ncbi:D-glycero-beta-D-manno-heptose 1,7-bisphosphate 7-phosphatase [Barrientosiimonas marina]
MTQAVFLDRDGVINEVLTERVTFVNEPGDFHLLDGVGEAIKLLHDKNYFVFVVTNQGGIGLGYMTKAALKMVHEQMQADLAQYGAVIDDIAYCPHAPHAGCFCRKPEPQMLLDLAAKHNIDLSESYMIGDREPDISAGKRAGVKTVLISQKERHTASADMLFPDLFTFTSWLDDA